MGSKHQVAIFLLMISALPSAVHSLCPEDFTEHAGKCYFFSSRSLTWYEARHLCWSYPDTTLAAVDSASEQQFLVTTIQANADFNGKNFWLSGTDIAKEGTWIWSQTGGKISPVYVNWGPGQPDNQQGNQHCMLMEAGSDYTWSDGICTERASTVCERSAV